MWVWWVCSVYIYICVCVCVCLYLLVYVFNYFTFLLVYWLIITEKQNENNLTTSIAYGKAHLGYNDLMGGVANTFFHMSYMTLNTRVETNGYRHLFDLISRDLELTPTK